MVAIALGSLVLSALTCWLIGHAYVSPPGAFLRTKFGVTLLLVGALSFVPLPPQIMSLDAGFEMLGSTASELAPSLAWPESLSKPVYVGLWITTSLVALLVGMRIWNAGKPGWRPGSVSNAWDSSAAGRARALVPMANSLDEVFDTLSRAHVDARGVATMAEELRLAGQRFAAELPQESGAAYRLVAARVGAAAAAEVTRYLLEGAGRGGQIAQTRG